MVVCASAFALVRLHATGGYGITRHGLVPGMLLTVAAGGGLAWLTSKVAIPGRWLGISRDRVRIPAPLWSMLVVAVVLVTGAGRVNGPSAGPFSVYHTAATWLARNALGAEKVLDMTDWALYLSGRPGYHFADVYKAPGDPATRWVVVRGPHVEGRWPYAHVVRGLIGDRVPAALIPARPGPGQLQIRIYDRQGESGPTIGRNVEPTRDRAARR